MATVVSDSDAHAPPAGSRSRRLGPAALRSVFPFVAASAAVLAAFCSSLDPESRARLLTATLRNVSFGACLALSILGYALVLRIIPGFAPKFVEAGLCGVDLSKRTTARNQDGSLVRPLQGVKVPEAVGVIPGAVYCFCITLFLPFAFLSANRSHLSGMDADGENTSSIQAWFFGRSGQEGHIERELEALKSKALYPNGTNASTSSSSSPAHITHQSQADHEHQLLAQQPHHDLQLQVQNPGERIQAQVDSFARMVQFLAAILSICSMSFFGFVDNVLNLRWRDKFLLPTLASLPILLVYSQTLGTTSVLLPLPLRLFFSFDIIDLGPFFYVFLAMITIFCVNAINIYAGVNGLEAGQSLIIALSLVLNNLIQLARLPAEFTVGRDRHLFSLYILCPFAAVTLGILKFNWYSIGLYPSQVFVGDTFCYFAGMTLAVAGIFGHYSKTLLLFLLPQLLNFVYGLPQLLRLIECPRHRLPAYDAEADVSRNSFATVCEADLSGTGRFVFRLYKLLRLCKVEEVSEGTGPNSNANDRTKDGGAVAVGAVATSISRKEQQGDIRRTASARPSSGKDHVLEARGRGSGGTILVSEDGDSGSGTTITNTNKCSKIKAKTKTYRVSNLTLINFVLYVFGPMHEETLVVVLLALQVLFSALAFWLRYFVSASLYTKVL
eukprot:g12834.t1